MLCKFIFYYFLCKTRDNLLFKGCCAVMVVVEGYILNVYFVLVYIAYFDKSEYLDWYFYVYGKRYICAAFIFSGFSNSLPLVDMYTVIGFLTNSFDM